VTENGGGGGGRVVGEDCKMISFMNYTPYQVVYDVKSRKVGLVGRVEHMGDRRDANRVFDGET
jgi:hypothetical protein